jgi:hypothetical protein
MNASPKLAKPARRLPGGVYRFTTFTAPIGGPLPDLVTHYSSRGCFTLSIGLHLAEDRRSNSITAKGSVATQFRPSGSALPPPHECEAVLTRQTHTHLP